MLDIFLMFFYCISSVLLILYQLNMSSLLCHSRLSVSAEPAPAILSMQSLPQLFRQVKAKSESFSASRTHLLQSLNPAESNKSSALCQAALPGNIISCQAHV